MLAWVSGYQVLLSGRHCLECDLERVTSLLSAVHMPSGDVTPSRALQALRLILVVVAIVIVLSLVLVLLL